MNAVAWKIIKTTNKLKERGKQSNLTCWKHASFVMVNVLSLNVLSIRESPTIIHSPLQLHSNLPHPMRIMNLKILNVSCHSPSFYAYSPFPFLKQDNSPYRNQQTSKIYRTELHTFKLPHFSIIVTKSTHLQKIQNTVL